MLVLGLITSSPTLMGTGFTLAVGVSLAVAVVYCGVFAADESRERRMQQSGNSART
jgi:hypothetical protein